MAQLLGQVHILIHKAQQRLKRSRSPKGFNSLDRQWKGLTEILRSLLIKIQVLDPI